MSLSQYTTIIFLLILINLTSQLILIPYWLRLHECYSYYEYNGRLYKNAYSMIEKMFYENKIQNIEKLCIYNVGIRRGRSYTLTYLKECESAMSYFYPSASYISYNVKSPNRHRPYAYVCNGRKFFNFNKAIECSLMFYTYIELKKSYNKPTFQPKNFYIKTLSGPLYYMKNPGTYDYWKLVWWNCNGGCYFHKNFDRTKKHYFDEINMYRKFLGHNPLEMSSSLCASAQSRADKMANQNRLFTDNEQEYDEYVFSSEQGHGMYAVKILFDNVFFEDSSFCRKATKKRKDFGRILSHELKTIGIGIAKSGLETYACIKFSTNWKRSSTIQIPRGQE